MDISGMGHNRANAIVLRGLAFQLFHKTNNKKKQEREGMQPPDTTNAPRENAC